MKGAMADTALVSVFCADRTGLVAAITGLLFELGVNLGDTSFAVLGEGAEFSSLCELPDGVPLAAIEDGLAALPELDGAEVAVRSFGLDPSPGPSAVVTHHVTVSGGDQPGLVARLCETFVQFRANIVSLNAGVVPESEGGRYVVRFAVWIPDGAAESCLATVANTAGTLRLTCHWQLA